MIDQNGEVAQNHDIIEELAPEEVSAISDRSVGGQGSFDSNQAGTVLMIVGALLLVLGAYLLIHRAYAGTFVGLFMILSGFIAGLLGLVVFFIGLSVYFSSKKN